MSINRPSYLSTLDGLPFIPRKYLKEYIVGEDNKIAFEMARKFVLGETDKGVYIHGGIGVGKSHLAATIIREWSKRSKTTNAIYANFPILLKDIQLNFNYPKEDFDDILPDIVRARLLVLDDVGNEHITDWTKSILYTIVNGRYELDYPIVVTTNFSPKELAIIEKNNIVSRLCEMCNVVEIKSEDRRIKS